MNIRTRVIATVSLLMVFGLFLQAQTKPKLNEPELQVFRVATQNGKEVFIPGSKAKPGELLEYRLVLKNNLSVPATNLEPIIPVPAQLVFEPNANFKAPTAASTDGKKYGPLPLKRRVERAGVAAEELVPLSEYRFLRWTIPTLAPGESVEVKARMRVSK